MSDPNDPKSSYPILAYSYRVRACGDCGMPTLEFHDEEGRVITFGHIEPNSIDELAAELHRVAQQRRN